MKRNSWFTFGIIMLTAICFAAGQFKVPPTMVAAMEELGVGLTQGGLLMSAVGFVAIFLALFGGLLTVRFKARNIAIFSISCTLAGNVLGFFAPNFALLFASRMLEGVGYGMQTAVLPTIIASLFDEEERGVPMALYSAWVSIGMLFMFNFSNVLIPIGSWRTCWLACALMLAVVLVLFCLFVKTPEDAPGDACELAWPDYRSAVLAETRNPSVWSLAVVFTIFGFGCAVFTAFAPSFCIQHLGMDSAMANAGTGMLSIGMIAGSFIMSLLLKRRQIPKASLLVLATVLNGIFFTCAFTLSMPWQVVPFCLAFGIVLQMIPPIVFSCAPEAASKPATAGVVVGVVTCGDHLGSSVGSMIVGGAVEAALGSWGAAVPVMGLFALVGLFGAISYWNKERINCRGLRKEVGQAQTL